MDSPKNKSFVIAIVLFCVTALAVVTGLFAHPVSAGEGTAQSMDTLFYYTIHFIFWMTGAYILNVFIRRLLWGKVFKISAGSKTIGLIEDFSTVFVYMMAVWIILMGVLDQEASSSWFVIFLIFFFLITLVRPKILRLFNNKLISSSRPFKAGDWIRLTNSNGSSSVTGEVLDFDRTAIQLKTENDTLVFFPNLMLGEFLIENYKGIQHDVRQTIFFEVSACVNADRAKRILKAAVKHALLEYGEQKNSPEVLVSSVKGDKVEYKINYWIDPWGSISPEKARDLVLSNILNHLSVAGIEIIPDGRRHALLENINIFSPLGKMEIDRIDKAAARINIKEGDSIIRQGEKGDSMYVLAEGLLNVFVQSGSNGNGNLKVASIAPGQFFGEMSLFTGEDRSATVNADTDSLVLEIRKDMVRHILKEKPSLADEFGRIIAERQSSNLHILDEFRQKKDTFLLKLVSSIRSYFDLKD